MARPAQKLEAGKRSSLRSLTDRLPLYVIDVTVARPVQNQATGPAYAAVPGDDGLPHPLPGRRAVPPFV